MNRSLKLTRVLVAFAIVGGGASVGLAVAFGLLGTVPTPVTSFLGVGIMLGIFYVAGHKASSSGL